MEPHTRRVQVLLTRRLVHPDLVLPTHRLVQQDLVLLISSLLLLGMHSRRHRRIVVTRSSERFRRR